MDRHNDRERPHIHTHIQKEREDSAIVIGSSIKVREKDRREERGD